MSSVSSNPKALAQAIYDKKEPPAWYRFEKTKRLHQISQRVEKSDTSAWDASCALFLVDHFLDDFKGKKGLEGVEAAKTALESSTKGKETHVVIREKIVEKNVKTTQFTLPFQGEVVVRKSRVLGGGPYKTVCLSDDGAFGQIKKVTWKTKDNKEGVAAVLKVQNLYQLPGKKKSVDLSRAESEFSLQRKCAVDEKTGEVFPSILPVYARFVYVGKNLKGLLPYTPTKFGIVMELADDSLENCFNHFSLQEIFRHTLSAMQRLEECQIAHCDISMRNFFLGDDKQLKLADFGWAHEIDKLKKCLDEEHYNWGPEFVLGSQLEIEGSKGDILAWGGVLKAVKEGGLKSASKQFGTGNSWTHEVLYRSTSPVRDSFDEMIFGMVQREPSKRFTLKQVMDHPWAKEALAKK